MKKIAFIGEPQAGTVRRFDSFIKLSPDYEYTFVRYMSWVDGVYDYHPVQSINYFNVIDRPQFNPSDFDLVMVGNDKFFSDLIAIYSPLCYDVTNKRILNQLVERTNNNAIKVSGFLDNETVFVKPKKGSGQYSDDEYGYRCHKFKDIKHLSANNYVIQQFFSNPSIISLLYVCNGQEINFVDITDATYLFDETGKILNTHVESVIKNKEQYQKYIDASERFIKSCGYVDIPGVYMPQFMTDNDQIYLIDFNVRTGPATDAQTYYGFIDHSVHKMIPFIIGDKTFDEVYTPHIPYRCYLERDGHIISPRVKNPDMINRILLSSDSKTSGLIRNDYNTYLEKI